MTDNHEISVAWQRAREALDLLGAILAERGLAGAPAGRGHVAVHSIRDTSESFADFAARMTREGKYQSPKPPSGVRKKGREPRVS